MSSKALLPDVVGAVNKRVRRSWSNQFSKTKTEDPTDKSRIDSAHICWGDDTTTLDATNDSAVTTKPASDITNQQDEQSPPSPQLTLANTQVLSYTHSLFPPLPPDTKEFPLLPRPVLIPRLNPGVHIPFARCYAPSLESHSISKADFIAFLDSLNLIIRPHPAITLTEFAAIVVGFVPYDAAEGAGAAVEGLAAVAHIAATYNNIKKFFRIMNEEYFHPRRLHVKIINTKRLRREFEIAKKTPLVLPLTEETLDSSPQERCLRFLAESHACALDFEEIPPLYHTFVSDARGLRPKPSMSSADSGTGSGKVHGGNGDVQTVQFQPMQQTRMERLAAWRVKHLIAKSEKQAKRSRKRAWKKHQKGKPLKENCDEKWRLNQLDWVFIQNLSEWEAQKAAKAAKKEEKKKKKQKRAWNRRKKETEADERGLGSRRTEGVVDESPKEVGNREAEAQTVLEREWRDSVEVVRGTIIDLPIRTIGTGSHDRASTWSTVR